MIRDNKWNTLYMSLCISIYVYMCIIFTRGTCIYINIYIHIYIYIYIYTYVEFKRQKAIILNVSIFFFYDNCYTIFMYSI